MEEKGAPTKESPSENAAERCPACGYLSGSGAPFEVCPRCGIILAKYWRRHSGRGNVPPGTPPAHKAPAAPAGKRLLWAVTVLVLVTAAVVGGLAGGKDELRNALFPDTAAPSENSLKLFQAVEQNDVDKVRRLLQVKDGPNFVVNGSTPLEVALRKEFTDVATMLVQNGANLSLNRAPDSPSLVQECVSRDLTRSVSCLLSLNAPLEDLTPKGQAPIVQAVANGNYEMVKLLIEHGKSVNTRDRYGNCAIIDAARAGRADIVKLLIENGADVNARDKFGYTPLMWCMKNTPVVAMLIDAGADINAKSNINYTPLHCAVASLNLDAVRLLVQKGAAVSAKDAHGLTPLKMTTLHGNATPDPFPEMAAILRNAGAAE